VSSEKKSFAVTTKAEFLYAEPRNNNKSVEKWRRAVMLPVGLLFHAEFWLLRFFASKRADALSMLKKVGSMMYTKEARDI